jgi:hypothetical protein
MSSQPKSQDFIVQDGKSWSSDSDSRSWNCSQALKTGHNELINFLGVGSLGISFRQMFSTIH